MIPTGQMKKRDTGITFKGVGCTGMRTLCMKFGAWRGMTGTPSLLIHFMITIWMIRIGNYGLQWNKWSGTTSSRNWYKVSLGLRDKINRLKGYEAEGRPCTEVSLAQV